MLLIFSFSIFGFVNAKTMCYEFYKERETRETIKRNIFKHFTTEKVNGHSLDIIQNHMVDKKTKKLVKIKETDKEKIIPITKKQAKLLFYINNTEDPRDLRNESDINICINRPYSQIYMNFNVIKEIMEELIKEEKKEEEKLKIFYLCFEVLFEIFEANFLEIVKVNNYYKTWSKSSKGGEECWKNWSLNKDEEELFLKLGLVRGDLAPECKYEELYTECKYFEYFVYKFLRNNIAHNRKDIEVMKHRINLLRSRFVFDIDSVNGYLGMRITTMLQCLELLDTMYEKFLDFTKNIKDKSLLNLKFAEKIFFKKRIEQSEGMNWYGKNFYRHLFEIERKNSLTDDVKGMEEFFNQEQTIKDFTSYLKEILKNLNCSEKEGYDFSYYLDFINRYTNKIINNSFVLNNIKKEIELRKEIMPIIERITQKEVYENIINKIMSFVGEEDLYKEKAFRYFNMNFDDYK